MTDSSGMETATALESGDARSEFHVVTYDDENGNEIAAQLNIHLTDEGVVFDLYDMSGNTLLKSGYLFAQDIVDEGYIR